MIPCYPPSFGFADLLAACSTGRRQEEFEFAFAQHAGARFGVSFSYASAAILATLKALGLRDQEVIVPAYTCRVVPAAVLASGNRPRFVDINDDYNMDVNRILESVGPRTGAVLATHMYGVRADVEAIRAAIRDPRVFMVEDSAQAWPNSTKLRGDVAVFSTSRGKSMSTVCGGMAVTNSEELHQRIKAVRDSEMNVRRVRVGMKRFAWFLASYLTYRKYPYSVLSHWRSRKRASALSQANMRGGYDDLPADVGNALAEFQGRVGLVQLNKSRLLAGKRRQLAEIYDQELGDCRQLRPPACTDCGARTLYTIRVPGRDGLQFRLEMERRGVQVDCSYDFVLPHLPRYRRYATGAFPNAAKAATEVVNLPLHAGLSEKEVRFIAACARDCAGEGRNKNGKSVNDVAQTIGG